MSSWEEQTSASFVVLEVLIALADGPTKVVASEVAEAVDVQA